MFASSSEIGRKPAAGSVYYRRESSVVCSSCQGKRSILRRVGSDRLTHGMRVKFNPLALLLDSSLEGEYDLVQRVIYDVSHVTISEASGAFAE